MKITFLHHSGIVLEFNKNVFIFDFYEDSLDKENGYLHELYNKFKHDLNFFFLSSHKHYDHFDKEILNFSLARFILSSDIKDEIGNRDDLNITYIKKGEVINLSYDGSEHIELRAFGSTDLGVSFALYIDNIKFFHAGDLNYWHWINESTVSEVSTYLKMYTKELNFIKKTESDFDYIFFPIDPRLEVKIDEGALMFCNTFKVKTLIPIHACREFDKTNACKDKFQALGVNFIEVNKRGFTIMEA